MGANHSGAGVTVQFFDSQATLSFLRARGKDRGMQSALYLQELQNRGAPTTTPPGGTQNGRGGGTPVGQQHGSGGGTVESCKVSTLPYWSTHWPTSNP